MGMLVGGIDEAGRGALVGPLLIAGVAVEDEKIALLEELGARDSKKLSRKRRERVYAEMLPLLKREVVVEIPPSLVDRYVFGVEPGKLNRLEALKSAELLDALGADVVYVDSVDPNPERYRELILRHVRRKVRVLSEHRADEKYAVVSAASIVAKVRRDARIRELSKEFGEIGSGYPADARTLRFVKSWLLRFHVLPPPVRKSWSTAKGLLLWVEGGATVP